MTFNIGDKIRRVKGNNHVSSPPVSVGYIGVIKSIKDDEYHFEDGAYASVRNNEGHWELVISPIEAAKALLIAEGYMITDPPKPRSRRVVAYTFGETGVIYFAEEGYFKRNASSFNDPIVIETFDWTEKL